MKLTTLEVAFTMDELKNKVLKTVEKIMPGVHVDGIELYESDSHGVSFQVHFKENN